MSSLHMESMDIYTMGVPTRHKFDTDRNMASAYVWGRQDAAPDARTCDSYVFGVAVAMVRHLTDGGGPLIALYREWLATDRILVAIDRHTVVALVAVSVDGTTVVQAHHIPWSGTSYGINNWQS